MKKLKRIGLIDADIIAYKASSVVEKTIKWDDNICTIHVDEDEALAIAQEKIEKIKEDVKADVVYLCFSDKENFRKSILPTYKHNRADLRKPLCLSGVKERLAELYTVYILPRLEADDVLGIMATSPKLEGEKIIITVDKDLKQVPCKMYNLDKKKFSETTPEQSQYYHYMQTLMGDITDGYTGCPGVGVKTAEKILKDAEDPWAAIVDTFVKKGLTEEDALAQARVAYILRHGDFIDNKVKLWKPKTK